MRRFSLWVLLRMFHVPSTIAVANSFSSTSSARFHITPIPQVSASEFHPYAHYFHTHKNNNDEFRKGYETPVLVKNALSAESCQWVCDTLLDQSEDLNVDLQWKRRNKKSVKTDILQCTLDEAFGYMMESNHDNAYFSFCEGLFDDYDANAIKMNQIKSTVNDAKEALFRKSENCKEDLFEYFPSEVKPSDCVILAGEGACSTLHRDPFSWTGTSICLEGTKIWRFVAPPGATSSLISDVSDDSAVHKVDTMLDAYRLPSMTWQDDDTSENSKSIPLSAGWQSDFSLYASRNDELVPSAEQFAYMEEEDIQQKYSKMDSISQSVDALYPSSSIMEDNSGKDDTISIWSVVQKPGDLLIIPAFWWHQTYALEPSLAVASQRCALDKDAPRVIRHILQNAIGNVESMNDLPELLRKNKFDPTIHSPNDIVQELFSFLGKNKNFKIS